MSNRLAGSLADDVLLERRDFSGHLGPLGGREYEVLRVSGALLSEEGAAKARKAVLNWYLRKNRISSRSLPSRAWQFEDFEHWAGGRGCWAVGIKNEGADVWALRAEDPDSEVPGRVWSVEVVIGWQSGGTPRLSLRLLTTALEGRPSITPAVPRFVRVIAEEVGLLIDGRFSRSHPIYVESREQAEELADFLQDGKRLKPVVVIDLGEQKDGNLIDRFSAQLVGLAHVVVLGDGASWVLTQRFGKELSVFHGGVRVYFPGFGGGAPGYRHRLFLAQELLTVENQQSVYNIISYNVAAYSYRHLRLEEDVLTFSSVRSAAAEIRSKRLENDDATPGQLVDQFKRQIDAIKAEKNDLDGLLQLADQEISSANEKIFKLESELMYVRNRLDIEISKNNEKLSGGENPEIWPDNWDDVKNWIDRSLAGSLVINSSAARNIKKAQYLNVAEVCRCLWWLATDCRDNFIHGGGSLREFIISSGIRNSHCGSDSYETVWAGDKYSVEWHIKNGGNTRDPSRCLRIYYFWDAARRQIVVDDMPAHRRTDAT